MYHIGFEGMQIFIHFQGLYPDKNEFAPFVIKVNCKRKEFAPETPFLMGLDVLERKQEVTNIVSIWNNARVIRFLKKED